MRTHSLKMLWRIFKKPLGPRRNMHILLCLVLNSIVLTCGAIATSPDTKQYIVATSWTDIDVNLSVYLSSIAGTAWFTWMLAKYESKRSKKVDKLEAQVEALLSELQHEKKKNDDD